MTLEAQVCINCGIEFAAPEKWTAQRRKDGVSFYCPNGHSQHFRFGPSDADKLRQERDRLAQRVAERDDEIRRQREMREATERQLAAQKGQVTKLKKRAGAGVCPCCNRTFAGLQRHMASKHPEFACEAA